MKIYRVLDAQHTVLYATSDDAKTFYALSDDPFYGELRVSNEKLEVSKVLVPIEPRTILCVGVNYKEHAKETGKPLPDYPVIFFKPASALLDPGDPIQIPRALPTDQVDYEVELAIVIGTRCKNATRANALDYVLGYTVANDVSSRDWQMDKGGTQWCRGKMFDTFLPLGPCIVTKDDLPDPGKLGLFSRLNGKTMQSSNTSDMLFDVPAIIEFLSGSTTLEPGTVILTGTPPGVGIGFDPPVFMKDGDTIEVEVEQIGTLANPVINEPV